MRKSFVHTFITAASVCVGLVILASARAEDTTQPSGYAVSKTLAIGGEGRWDYANFDPASHLLFVTRATHTQVIDVAGDGKVVADIAPQGRSHGTAIVPSVNRGFITDGDKAEIVVFDLKTYAILGKIKAFADVDGVIYDPGTNRVLAACGDAQKIAVVDPSIDLKDAQAQSVDLGGSPEFLAADGQGNAYVNVNSKNQIAKMDLKTLAVTATWPTGTALKPTGLAIDVANHRLYIGCRSKQMVVMSTDDGHVLAELPIGGGVDACLFNPKTGEAFASCGDGTLAVIKETSPGKFAVSEVTTKPGSRTSAIDLETGTIYLPAAEMLPPPKGEKRPAMKPNSFMIVVVSPTADTK